MLREYVYVDSWKIPLIVMYPVINTAMANLTKGLKIGGKKNLT